VDTQVFSIAPTVGRAMWGLAIVPGLVLLLVIGLLGAAMAGARDSHDQCRHLC